MKLLINLCVNSNCAWGKLNSLALCIVPAVVAASFKMDVQTSEKSQNRVLLIFFLFYTDTINIV